MSSKRTKSFHVPGIYYPLNVKMVTGKWLGRIQKDPGTLATYEHEKGEIYVTKELAPQPKIHCFYHEISHHIIETLDEVEEETRCDVLGMYLMRLLEARDDIAKKLTRDNVETNEE